MQAEAENSTAYLEVDMEPEFMTVVEAVGDGRTDGSTRRIVTEKRERMRAQVLSRALEVHVNQQARPVLVWPQFDKLSTAWLLALPGPHSGLSSQVFSKALCAYLCLLSPACRDRVGETIARGVVVDVFGDKVMAAALPGDTWRIKHDEVKRAITNCCVYSGLPVTCEVFNLFAHLIPQEGLNRLERGRRRQALVPDFKITLSDPVEGRRCRLAELKCINCCPSRYFPRREQKAVDRRADLLQGEYRKKARDVDRGFVGVEEEQTTGPVERRLAEFSDLQGLLVGALSEASEDLHNLIHAMAESRVAGADLCRDQQAATEREDMSVVVGQLRRRLSVAVVRATSNCLLSRISLIGEASRQAAKRRQWSGREEMIMRQEREAQWHRRVRGHGVRHRGEFVLTN